MTCHDRGRARSRAEGHVEENRPGSEAKEGRQIQYVEACVPDQVPLLPLLYIIFLPSQGGRRMGITQRRTLVKKATLLLLLLVLLELSHALDFDFLQFQQIHKLQLQPAQCRSSFVELCAAVSPAPC